MLPSYFGTEFPPKETDRASSPNAALEPPSVQLGSVSRGGRHITKGLARSTSQRKCLCFYSQQAANFFWCLLEDQGFQGSQKNLQCILSQHRTYLGSQERLVVIEAAQDCRQGVEGIAFLRHLSVPGPWTTHFPFSRVKRNGAWASEPQPAVAAPLLPPAVQRPAGGVSRLLLLAGQSGTSPSAEANTSHSFNSGRLMSSLPGTQCQKSSCDQTCFLMKF